MKSNNRDGIKYEVLPTITVPYQPAVPAVLDEQGQVVTPEVPAVDQVVEDKETGLQCGIEITIPPKANTTRPHIRTAELLNLVVENDLQMKLQIRINHYSPDGTPLTQSIQNDVSLTLDQRNYLLREFGSFDLEIKSTRGSWILNGTVMNHFEEGAIPELEFYQQVTRNELSVMGLDLSEEKRPMQMLYAMFKMTIAATVTRVGL